MTECEFRIYKDKEYLCQNKIMGESTDYTCENCIDE